MRRKMNVASVVLSIIIAASSVCGCGGSTHETATTAQETYTTESTSDQAYYEEPTAATEYYEEEACEAPAATADKSAAGAENSYETAMCETEDCTDIYDPYVQEYNTESYEKPEENGYDLVTAKPLSTFAADVDTASYSNVRRMIEDGYSLTDINPSAVRPEEFINYFSYDLNNPVGDEKFGITTEIAKCPWNEDHELMFVGMKTRDIDLSEAPDSNLVFLVDVSGSMDEPDKLPLLQKSLTELVDTLPDKGCVSIVTYSGQEAVLLSGTSMKNKSKIKDAIDSMQASGCTNGEAGIQKAYKIAENNFIKGGINRIIMCTDGDLNVGVSNPDDLEKLIEQKRDKGIFLSVLGFGSGNLKDDNLERLADCGNGNYSYIDSLFEGKKVLIDEMGSTLVTVAKDVKLQVEFNPERVNSYRLIGYENRLMNDEDFNDDTKDGGEIGAGHSVVALYEIIPAGAKSEIKLKYQDNDSDNKKEDNRKKDSDSAYSDEYATVSVRYKEPEADKSQLFSVVVGDKDFYENGSENLKFAGLVAEFAMILSDSEYKGTATLTGIMDDYKTIETKDEYRDEFGQLVRMMAKRS
ncbi:vWA domain-containing protein [Butyrivibrio sp. WCD2001]|uniref:vWA domain-containing protein n=1 Tax=Butyrivibrio sp. WCD2001 TaxID=1280681 RepID=UPI000419A7FC|nr:VWA domain-containing protein [Butyrivibrio sp. WCD2001]